MTKSYSLVDMLLYVQTYAWHQLLNCRQKGCKLKLGIYIDDDNELHEDADMEPVGTAAGNKPELGM